MSYSVTGSDGRPEKEKCVFYCEKERRRSQTIKKRRVLRCDSERRRGQKKKSASSSVKKSGGGGQTIKRGVSYAVTVRGGGAKQ